MSRALKVLMLSSVSVVVALGAVAQDTSLEDRIAALEAMVSELNARLPKPLPLRLRPRLTGSWLAIQR